MKRLVILFVIVGLVAGMMGMVESVWSAEKARAGSDTVTKWIKTEIYFGRDIPGAQEISRGAWGEFLNRVITPRFPKGLTVYDAYGQMQRENGRIDKQSTWVVILVHPEDPAIDKAVQAVIDEFRKQFKGAQVMLLNAPTTAQFFAD